MAVLFFSDQDSTKSPAEKQLCRSAENKQIYDKLFTDLNSCHGNVDQVVNSTHSDSQVPSQNGSFQNTRPVNAFKHVKRDSSSYLLSSIYGCFDYLWKNYKQQKYCPVNQHQLDDDCGNHSNDNTVTNGVTLSGDKTVAPKCGRERKHVQVLITGSIHLVGGALKIFQDKEDGFES